MKNYKLTIFPSLKDNDLTHAIFSRWVVKSASMGAIWGNSSAAYLKKKSFTHSRNQQWKTPNTIISESLTRTMLQLTQWKSSPKQLPLENNAYQVMHLHNRQDSCIMLNRNLVLNDNYMHLKFYFMSLINILSNIIRELACGTVLQFLQNRLQKVVEVGFLTDFCCQWWIACDHLNFEYPLFFSLKKKPSLYLTPTYKEACFCKNYWYQKTEIVEVRF